MSKNLGLWRMNDVFTNWIDQNYKAIIDTDLTYYTPEVFEDPLNIVLSEFLKLNQEIIYTAPGTNQLIHSILNWKKWRKVFIISPEYGLYEKVAEQAFNIENIVIIEATGIQEFIKEISAVESTEEDILCFSSPRWYTGEKFQKSDIEEILSKYKGTVLIDEAYADYSYNTNENLLLAELNERVILLRGFSKGWFVQGLRVGYAITNKFDESFRTGCIVPHSVSSPTSRFIELLIRDKRIMRVFELLRGNIIKTREFLYNELKDIECVTVFNSEANFLTVLIEDSELKKKLMNFRNVVDIHKGEKEGIKIWITNMNDAKEYIELIKKKYKR
ncbi:aminotransferase class I/II-fold pyridoxal phosphate-dependent enzyme [Clostridiaceae bacterium M8S5]|nr:aminotransferase class I/II-fold pyridoxal phosphate-dependent enzyme [Clostridiaceae bacterium M8S5]